MAQLTRKAIIQSFTLLLSQKPFEKITVRDIVDCCGITRNTFYYHFEDVYAVWEALLAEQHEQAMAAMESTGNWVDGYLLLLHFVQDHREAAIHICNSSRKEELYRYIHSYIGRVVKRYVDEKTAGLPVSEEDRQLVITLNRCALVGMFTEWVQAGLPPVDLSQTERMERMLTAGMRAAFSIVRDGQPGNG